MGDDDPHLPQVQTAVVAEKTKEDQSCQDVLFPEREVEEPNWSVRMGIKRTLYRLVKTRQGMFPSEVAQV